ncbi:homeobox protein 2 [Leptopilina heterotoma]|uniref:homeobox protein 2 n=1 Tax=Leptopilina heterotoma TaxID=63436 RepID=UPI001CA8CEB9|nr:homeobox protein 2 [Leptopilina heterotoma]
MDESTRLTDPPNNQQQQQNNNNNNSNHHHHQQQQQQQEFRDDECSTDSGCSSGSSTGSAERLSKRGSGDRFYEGGKFPRTHHYLDQLRGRSSNSRSQEKLSRRNCSNERSSRAKSSRSWSPSDCRSRPSAESPFHSQSPSDAHSSDSDSLQRPSASSTLRKALQSLKLSGRAEKTEKKHTKKSPKRILRSPVTYTYVKGLSGLPTQRVPKIATTHHQIIMPCTCQDSIGLYR